MIGYRVSLADLEDAIKRHKPDWLTRARKRTAAFRAKKAYTEKASIWSEIKVVYMRLQGGEKCAFCERKLESQAVGKGEQDVEHFRPKKNVKPWKAPSSLAALPFAAPPRKGYFLLPYHPFNYSASCKPCNSALKRDHFPVAGKHAVQAGDPRALSKEKPYLIYPIGDFDDDPEKLIEFIGVSPAARAKSGHPRARALVTIEFFALDDHRRRKNLVRERAMVLIALHPQLERTASGTAAQRAAAAALVRAMTADSAPHANCARSFVRLHRADPARALALFDAAARLITSWS